MTKIFLIILFLLCGCSHVGRDGDRQLGKHEIPAILRKYTSYEDAEFFAKKNTYEVKYEEVSLTFSEDGKLLEKEEDIPFKSLPKELQTLITNKLGEDYPGYRMVEVERRNDAFIDVEIKHPSSKTGYWEISFDGSGNIVRRELEEIPLQETLN